MPKSLTGRWGPPGPSKQVKNTTNNMEYQIGEGFWQRGGLGQVKRGPGFGRQLMPNLIRELQISIREFLICKKYHVPEIESALCFACIWPVGLVVCPTNPCSWHISIFCVPLNLFLTSVPCGYISVDSSWKFHWTGEHPPLLKYTLYVTPFLCVWICQGALSKYTLPLQCHTEEQKRHNSHPPFVPHQWLKHQTGVLQ